MRKYLFAIILFLSAALSAYCDPFAIVENEEAGSSRDVALASIVRKRPVYFQVKNYGNKNNDLNLYVQTAFRKWFYNLEKHINANPVQGKSLAKYSDIIEFASSEKAYLPVVSGQRPDVIIHFLSNYSELSEHCILGAEGCYKDKNIYLMYPKKISYRITDDDSDMSVLLHEIGHVFILDDLYNKSKENYTGTYGSIAKNSIMNRSKTLTCDDADGLITAVWLTLKKQKSIFVFDLDMPSFCNNGVSYHNGMFKNRESNYKDSSGKRTFTSYCQNGSVAQVVEFDAINFDRMIIYKTKNLCIAPNNEELFYNQPFVVVNKQLKEKFAHLSKFNSEKERIFYKPLIKGSGGLYLFVHTDSVAPVFSYILDDNNNVVFLFAHLQGNLNFVYDYPFSSQYKIGDLYDKNNFKISNSFESSYIDHVNNTSKGNDEVFVYDRNVPEHYYLLNAQNSLCKDLPEKCAEMRSVSIKYFNLFKEYLPLLSPSGRAERFFPYAAKHTLSWDKYLVNKFQPLSVLGVKKGILNTTGKLKIKPLTEIEFNRSRR